MIAEHEIIEQIEEEENGRPLAWSCDLIRGLGRADPLMVLQEMWRASYVTLVDDTGRVLPPWRCEEVFREQGEWGPVRVVATSHGFRWDMGSIRLSNYALQTDDHLPHVARSVARR